MLPYSPLLPLFILCHALPSVRSCRREYVEQVRVLRKEVASLTENNQHLRGEVEELRSSVMHLNASISKLSDVTTSLLPQDCSEARARGAWNTVAMVAPPGLSPREVACEQREGGGGWTVVLARRPVHHDPHQRINFNVTWAEYRQGFGDPREEYWIGNEVLHALTRDVPHHLRVSITTWDGHTYISTWEHFRVGSEAERYVLEVTGYDQNSTAGDAFDHHHTHPFSTHDQDNDVDTDHCAKSYGGGWWYNKCYDAHLTGTAMYPGAVDHHEGIVWRRGKWYPTQGLKAAYMMIRPHTHCTTHRC